MITLNGLLRNLLAHVDNQHKGEAQVYVSVDGKTIPVELGGVSTFGDTVVIFVSKKEAAGHEESSFPSDSGGLPSQPSEPSPVQLLSALDISRLW